MEKQVPIGIWKLATPECNHRDHCHANVRCHGKVLLYHAIKHAIAQKIIDGFVYRGFLKYIGKLMGPMGLLFESPPLSPRTLNY